MNGKFQGDTERFTRGIQAEYRRDKQAQQKEYRRPDEATIIVSKPSLMEKLEKRWQATKYKKK